MPISNDFDLQPTHVQGLAGREEVVGLFAALGYNTEARLTQTAEAMGLTNEALRRDIRHIERIADHENGSLQVYLAELKSVTVANIQALARNLRVRAGNFLWVLTTDYEQIDFVLFELTLPASQSPASGLSLKSAYLRPRALSVNRRNPGSVNLRVLRRFSYTEADAIFQLEKLKSAYGVAEWAEEFFNNRALFSDYYLKERLPEAQEWAEAEGSAVDLRAFQALYAGAREKVSGKNEAEARRLLLEPALKALGYAWQKGKASTGKTAEPDYYLLGGDGATPAAYCNVYVWGRNLDGRDDESRDPDTPDENPGALVVSLLEQDDALDWAIVTNGKAWRLYSRQAHSRAANYYEIDLEEAIASPDPGLAFRYFWLIFRAAAFQASEEKAAKSFLDRVLAESALYARELETRLKDRVFAEIFPRFAEGFIADFRAREGKEADLSDELLRQVFQGTLTFLYRLLFLLYAEARDLLPARETRGYYEISLTRLKREAAERGGAIEDEAQDKLARAYSAASTELYGRLQALFRRIDEGDAALNLPLYNGGLFITHPADDDPTPEAANARFLLAHAIPDRYLAQGLDQLARDVDAKTQALALIDYKSLGVRQLGSIYEGLLEFKLRIAPAKMAVVKGKKTDEVIPFKEAEKAGRRVRETIPKGAAYLESDRRERKATGSYYTPDFFVKPIVRHAVGPALEEKCERMRPRLREAQKAYRQAVERQKKFQKQGMAGDGPEKVADTFKDAVDELFDLRVLDPAMGSGHFLVEAVDFVSDRLIDFLNAFPWNPVTAALRRTRESILDAMQGQGIAMDPARLTDVNLLRRHVLKRCVYGVDLNPMAVELAKVSLWLHCFTLGAPLSFLDHHLKQGNSLIGARIAEVQAALEMAEKQDMVEIPLLSGLMGSQFAGVMLGVDLMRRVGELPDTTAQEVIESRREFRRAPFRCRRRVSLSLGGYRQGRPKQTGRPRGACPAVQPPLWRSGRAPVLPYAQRPQRQAQLSTPERTFRAMFRGHFNPLICGLCIPLLTTRRARRR